MIPWVDFDVAPYRLSGVVYGTLLNDPATLAALGDAVNRPPYKAPPRAPVLYLKPRHTLAPSGSAVAVPADGGRLEISASLGIVVGRTACRVSAADAPDHIAGWVLVADLCVPHAACYRPSVRMRARDGSCLIGTQVAPRDRIADADDIELSVSVDGAPAQKVRTGVMTRPVARLLQDVTEFMTLRPGDLLLLGLAAGAPQAGAGQSFAIESPGLGRLGGHLVAETPQPAVAGDAAMPAGRA